VEPGSPRILAPRRPSPRRRRWPILLAVAVASLASVGATVLVRHEDRARPPALSVTVGPRRTTTTMSPTTTTVTTTTTTTTSTTIPTVVVAPPPTVAVARRPSTTTVPSTTTTTTDPPPSTTTTTARTVPPSSPDVDARDDRGRVNGDTVAIAVLDNDLPRAGMLDRRTLRVEIEPPVGTTRVLDDGRILYRGPPNVRYWYRICSTTGGCAYAAVTIYPASA
jgi:hypothetical protein